MTEAPATTPRPNRFHNALHRLREATMGIHQKIREQIGDMSSEGTEEDERDEPPNKATEARF